VAAQKLGDHERHATLVGAGTAIARSCRAGDGLSLTMDAGGGSRPKASGQFTTWRLARSHAAR
jgi:hypothetical protein